MHDRREEITSTHPAHASRVVLFYFRRCIFREVKLKEASELILLRTLQQISANPITYGRHKSAQRRQAERCWRKRDCGRGDLDRNDYLQFPKMFKWGKWTNMGMDTDKSALVIWKKILHILSIVTVCCSQLKRILRKNKVAPIFPSLFRPLQPATLFCVTLTEK